MAVLKQVDRLWRIFATGFAFLFFGIGGLVLTLLVFPLIRVLTRSSALKQQRIRRSIRQTFRFFIFMLQALGVIRYRAAGMAEVADDRNTVIVANHPTLIDYVLITAELPDCDCIVKQALWHNFWLKGVVKGAGYIPNSAGEKVIELCRERLQANARLLIFPEGTRTTPGKAISVSRGAAQIALRSGADIRVLHIRCDPPTLSKAERWYQVPARKPCFELRCGRKIRTADFIENDTPLSLSARKLTRTICQELSKEFDRCLP